MADKSKKQLAVVEVHQGVKHQGEKKLVSCYGESFDVKENNELVIENRDNIAFTYDNNGKIVSSSERTEDCESPNDVEILKYDNTYKWDKNKITYVVRGYEDGTGTHTLTNGLITNTDFLADGYPENWYYTYNANNRLIGIGSKAHFDSESMQFNWDNLKLTEICEIFRNNKYCSSLNYKNTDTCKGYNPIYSILMPETGGGIALMLVHPELYGCKCTYLPTEIVDKHSRYDLEYTVDAEGYVTKCLVNRYCDNKLSDQDVFTFECE